MTLSQATLIDIRSTCDEIVTHLDDVRENSTGTAIEALVRTVAECAASVQTLADMVKALAEEAARG